MELQIFSDLHLEFEPFEARCENADVLILAGDIHVGEKGISWVQSLNLKIPTIYVLGNHEYYKNTYPKLVHKLKEITKDTNIYLLERDTISLDGIQFHGATLWTDFELHGDPRIAGYECQQVMMDFKKIRVEPRYSKLRSIDAAMIHKHSIGWLEKQLSEWEKTQKNVVITHHAPSIQSIPEARQDSLISSAYASHLDAFIKHFEPCLWIHGHLHNSSDYVIGKTRVICNPRGYPDAPNPHFNAEYIVTV